MANCGDRGLRFMLSCISYYGQALLFYSQKGNWKFKIEVF